MGAYLSSPVKDKESGEGYDGRFEYGVCAMQGWRTDMEDAHAVILDVERPLEENDSQNYPRTSLFAVFDGHGGKEVAQFCAAHISEALVSTKGYAVGDMREALRETFLKMDDIMVKQEHQAEFKALKGVQEGDESGTGDSTMTLDSAHLSEAFLDAFGIPRDSGLVFKVVKSSDGHLNVQNVLDREGNEVSVIDDMEEEQGAAEEMVPETKEDSQAKRKREASETPAGPFNDVPRDETDPVAIIEDAVENKKPVELEELSSSRTEEEWSGPGAGCTAVCAIVRGDQLFVANAGDSRCVLSRGGKAVALTEDHKPNNEEEFSRITKAGGFVADGRVNGSLNLSRALGDLEYKQVKSLPPEEQMVTANPEIRTIKLDPSDEFIILACDGIWDVLTNQEAIDFVRERLSEGKTPKEICEDACDFCLAPDTSGCGKGCDNMSIVISVLKESQSVKDWTNKRTSRAG